MLIKRSEELYIPQAWSLEAYNAVLINGNCRHSGSYEDKVLHDFHWVFVALSDLTSLP